MNGVSEMVEQQKAARAKMKNLLDTVRSENREMRASEARQFNDLESEINDLKERIEFSEEFAARQARKADEAREADAASARVALGLGDSDGDGAGSPVKVNRESMTYSRGGEHSYFGDLMRTAVSPDKAATARLERHAVEMSTEVRTNPNGAIARGLAGIQQRAGLTTTVGSGGSLLPPAYLLDDLIAYPRPTRVLSKMVRTLPLPKGPMVINVPKIQSPTLVNSQTTQNTAVIEQDLTDEYVSSPVVTLAGQQTVSLQAIEQSAVPFDEIVFSDLTMALDLDLETQVIAGTGANNQMTGVLNTTGIGNVSYTSGSPTASALFGYIAEATSLVFSAIYRPADSIFMTPARWAWIQSSVDNAGRPLVVPDSQGPFNAFGVQTGQLNNGVRPVGTMFSLPVYTSAAIPTNLGTGANQDTIIVASVKDLYLWESVPVARAVPQTLAAQMSVLLQTYEYASFMPSRFPGAVCTISGTGLSTPVFA